MALIGFKKQFAPAVLKGLKLGEFNSESNGWYFKWAAGQEAHTVANLKPKRCTIRRNSKSNPKKVGEKLYLYQSLRTKSTMKLGEVICTGLTPIAINPENRQVVRGKIYLSPHSIQELAESDGFGTVEEFWLFFDSFLEGVHIEW